MCDCALLSQTRRRQARRVGELSIVVPKSDGRFGQGYPPRGEDLQAREATSDNRSQDNLANLQPKSSNDPRHGDVIGVSLGSDKPPPNIAAAGWASLPAPAFANRPSRPCPEAITGHDGGRTGGGEGGEKTRSCRPRPPITLRHWLVTTNPRTRTATLDGTQELACREGGLAS